MIIPMFKAIATILLGILISGIFIIGNKIYNQQINPPIPIDMFFIVYLSVAGLIFLGIIYLLWNREIQIYYTKKKSLKK